jgi:hypothetical protein
MKAESIFRGNLVNSTETSISFCSYPQRLSMMRRFSFLPCTALPLFPLRRRQPLIGAGVVLLCTCLLGGVNAGQGDKPAPPAGAAKPDPSRSEDLAIPSGDHQLAATLYLPLAGSPAPAVVFVHGAGPAVRGDGYHELGRHFAQKGVAALI